MAGIQHDNLLTEQPCSNQGPNVQQISKHSVSNNQCLTHASYMLDFGLQICIKCSAKIKFREVLESSNDHDLAYGHDECRGNVAGEDAVACDSNVTRLNV
jgi:hypothetical protein